MSAIPQRYRAYGFTIASSFAIPGAMPDCSAASGDLADIEIRSGDTAIGTVDVANGPYRRSGDALLLDVPGVGRYLAASVRELLIEPAAGADPDDVAALLIATALPMLLWMRGGLMLHAAGVIPAGAGAAVAVAGPSGIGKSTLAKRLVEGGGRLVGDDSLLVSSTRNGLVASGLSGCCFLPVPGDVDVRAAWAVPPQQQAAAAPLAALVVLTPAVQPKPGPPIRLRGAAAIEAVLHTRHRPRIPAILKRDAATFSSVAALGRLVPIYQIAIPRADPNAAAALLLELCETHLPRAE